MFEKKRLHRGPGQKVLGSPLRNRAKKQRSKKNLDTYVRGCRSHLSSSTKIEVLKVF